MEIGFSCQPAGLNVGKGMATVYGTMMVSKVLRHIYGQVLLMNIVRERQIAITGSCGEAYASSLATMASPFVLFAHNIDNY